MNRRPWLVGTALPALAVALATASSAADVEPTGVLYDWSGLYIGGHIGYGDVDSDGFFATSVDLGFGGGNYLAGGQIGWNWQKDSWVFGIEHDFSWMDFRDENLREEHYIADSNFLSTLRGRVGWAHDNVLFYLTGGAALVHGEVTTSTGGFDEDQQGNTDAKNVTAYGGVIGAGLEWGLTPNMSLKTEGLYLLVNKRSSLANLEEGLPPGPDPDQGIPAGVPGNFFATQNGFVFRLGVNWLLWHPDDNGTEVEPRSSPEAYAGPYDWSGWYVGAHVGFGNLDVEGTYINDRRTNPPPPDPSQPAAVNLAQIDNRGLLGGIQAGWNWQFGEILFGIEGDVTGLDWNDLIVDKQRPLEPRAVAFDAGLLATLRAKAGITQDNFLYYVTGGAAIIDGEIKDVTIPDSKSVTAVGWAVGAGTEWAYTPNLSLKAEGLYLLFDHRTNLADLQGSGVEGDYLKLDDSFVFRLGANWRPWSPERAAATDPHEGGYGYDWSGFYVGAHAGWGGVVTNGAFNSSPLPNLAIDLNNVNDLGSLGGGQAGVNWQTGSIVYGIEGDVAAVDWDGRETEFYNPVDHMDFNAGLLATFRGRLGYAQDDLLFYITAGLAYLTAEVDNTGNLDDEGRRGRKIDISTLGGAAGLGMEWGVTPSLSTKVEGLALLFNENTNIEDIGGQSDRGDFFRIDNGFVVRVGANWRFNSFGAPEPYAPDDGYGPADTVPNVPVSAEPVEKDPVAGNSIWQVSGILNRAMLVWDDGDETGFISVDNPQDSSANNLDTIGIAADKELGQGWVVGFTLNFDTFYASGDSVDQINVVGDGAVVELPYAFAELGQDSWGKIIVGLADSASDEIDNINLAEADAISDASFENWMAQFYLRAEGIQGRPGLATGRSNAFNAENGELRWGDFMEAKFAGESGRVITYVSPNLSGFVASASVGQPQEFFILKSGDVINLNDRTQGVFWDAAVRYAQKFGETFEIEGGVGYWNDTTEEPNAVEPTEDTGLGGSLAVRHNPTGLNLAINYALRNHTDNCAEPGLITGDCRGPDEFFYLKGGMVRDLVEWGKTAFYGEYFKGLKHQRESDEEVLATLFPGEEVPELLELKSSDVTGWGFGLVQHIELIDTELYVGYRHYSLDVDLIGEDGPVQARKFDNLGTILAGVTVKFGKARKEGCPPICEDENASNED